MYILHLPDKHYLAIITKPFFFKTCLLAKILASFICPSLKVLTKLDTFLYNYISVFKNSLIKSKNEIENYNFRQIGTCVHYLQQKAGENNPLCVATRQTYIIMKIYIQIFNFSIELFISMFSSCPCFDKQDTLC